MNHANHKTTLNTIKANVILAGILANICADVYILHQLDTTLNNQKAILQNQTKIVNEISEINDTYSNIVELDAVYCKSVQVENLTATSSNKSKTTIKKENN